MVAEKVYGLKDVGSMVLINLGASYPNQPVTIVLRGEAKNIKTGIDGKVIQVTGKVIDYKGKPEIEVTNPKMITIDAVEFPKLRHE